MIKYFKKEYHEFTNYVKQISDELFILTRMSNYLRTPNVITYFGNTDFMYLGYTEISEVEYNSITEI